MRVLCITKYFLSSNTMSQVGSRTALQKSMHQSVGPPRGAMPPAKQRKIHLHPSAFRERIFGTRALAADLFVESPWVSCKLHRTTSSL